MRKIRVIVILITVFVLLFFGQDIFHNSVDYIQWKQLSSKLQEAKISEVILESGTPVKLAENEKLDLISYLKEARFYKSNWRKSGTTGPVITIAFKDGSKEYYEYCGNAIFETAYRDSQFLIKSTDIEAVLKRYNISLN
ncbi:MAG: hypothetical protein Q8930_16180 [Bacillota bacterium]|nr:hypothetical protein [Bacillota bacterium]